MIEVKNVPKKLWRGEYSLPITYWVFNVLIGNLILGNIIALIDPAKNISYFLVGLFLYLAYMITAAAGLWKSASLYKGNVPWGIFAKISVVFGASDLLACAKELDMHKKFRDIGG